MITFDNGIFSIQSQNYSFFLGLTKYGHLEQLYFGPAVALPDGPAFRCRPGLGWGASVLLEDQDAGGCMDHQSLAWSGSGRGDYRESPIEIGRATDLRYESHEILEGEARMEQGMPQAHGAEQTLIITLRQKDLICKLYFGAFPDGITRRTVLYNTAEEPVLLQKLMSFSMDLFGDFDMTSFHGSWISEMRKETHRVQMAKVVNESSTGASSNRHNPGFLLSAPNATQEHGLVYGINLIYSGNHYASAQKSMQGFTRVMQGINPANFQKTLLPGESFETPEAVLCCSREGFNGLSQRMHSFVSRHIIPPYWQGRPRPVLYNSWEGSMFDFTHRKLVSLAKDARELGCELFVLDDGWFGCRNDDTSSLGDYSVNLKKLPKGIDGLARDIRALGLEFGLWFEPESVSPNSDLYRAHPEWALTDGFDPVLGRHQLLLDLTIPEVRDYIVDNIGSILDSAGITYVKWDMNRHSIAMGAKAHEYILGLYDVLGRIFDPRPHILLESCSSGGNRFDLGMLCFGPQVWCSDNTDPIERLTIQENLSYLYPQSTFGAHVSASPHAQTLRNTPLDTRGNVSFFGCLGYEFNLKHLLPMEKTVIREQILFYKAYRDVFQYGAFRRMDGGWQVQTADATIAGRFRKLVAAAPGYEFITVLGLDPRKTYTMTSRQARLRIGQFGSLVKHVLPVDLNPNGVLLQMADRKITLPDGAQRVTASGAAFQSGIPLLPLFRGTGYDENQRTIPDFGSDIYILEEDT